jgi:hypothetical protein
MKHGIYYRTFLISIIVLFLFNCGQQAKAFIVTKTCPEGEQVFGEKCYRPEEYKNKIRDHYEKKCNQDIQNCLDLIGLERSEGKIEKAISLFDRYENELGERCKAGDNRSCYNLYLSLDSTLYVFDNSWEGRKKRLEKVVYYSNYACQNSPNGMSGTETETMHCLFYAKRKAKFEQMKDALSGRPLTYYMELQKFPNITLADYDYSKIGVGNLTSIWMDSREDKRLGGRMLSPLVDDVWPGFDFDTKWIDVQALSSNDNILRVAKGSKGIIILRGMKVGSAKVTIIHPDETDTINFDVSVMP